MKRFLTPTTLLMIALSVAACGGGEAQQAERAASSQQKQTAPATQRVTKESASRESAPQDSASRERAQGGEGSETAGISVTTLDGERANLGWQGDVTALYFMAGW